MQVIRVRIERALDSREFHVGSGRLESYTVRDAGELNALLELTLQLRAALHIGHGQLIHSPLYVNVTSDLLDLDGSFLLADFHVAGDIFDGGVGPLSRYLHIRIPSSHDHITPPRDDGHRCASRE